MSEYILRFKWWDDFDTTTSDGYSGGAVGWTRHERNIQAKDDKEAQQAAKKIIKEYKHTCDVCLSRIISLKEDL